jgi:hypothetical protein
MRILQEFLSEKQIYENSGRKADFAQCPIHIILQRVCIEKKQELKQWTDWPTLK